MVLFLAACSGDGGCFDQPSVRMDENVRLLFPVGMGSWTGIACRTPKGEVSLDRDILDSGGGQAVVVAALNRGYTYHGAAAWCAHRDGLLEGVR